MKRIQNVSKAKILVPYLPRAIRMEGTNDGISFIAIHEFLISLILFWISSFMGKDEMMDFVVERRAAWSIGGVSNIPSQSK